MKPCDCGQRHCARNKAERRLVPYTSQQMREMVLGYLSNYPEGRFAECVVAAMHPTLSTEDVHNALSILLDQKEVMVEGERFRSRVPEILMAASLVVTPRKRRAARPSV